MAESAGGMPAAAELGPGGADRRLCDRLEEALREEREALGQELERRHCLLLQEHRRQLLRLLGEAPGLSAEPHAGQEAEAACCEEHTVHVQSPFAVDGTTAEVPTTVRPVLPGDIPDESPRGGAPEVAPTFVGCVPSQLPVPKDAVSGVSSMWDSSSAGSPGHKRRRLDAISKANNRTIRERVSYIVNERKAIGESEFDDEVPPGLLQRIEIFVTGSFFELTFALFIVLNTVVMATEVQWKGMQNGERFGTRGPPFSLNRVFDVFEWFFGLIFALELLIKMIVLRKRFFFNSGGLHGQRMANSRPSISSLREGGLRQLWKLFDPPDWWNLVDLFIVLAWLAAAMSEASLPIDPMMLRLARLARLLRLMRLVRTIQGFDALYLLTATLKSSVTALLWSAVLLFIIQLMSALILNQLLSDYILNEKYPFARRHEVYKHFGTFTRAVYTVFELTLGNYAPIGRLLMDNVNEWYGVLTIVHKCSIGFAVVSVIRGVFMHETFKVAATDDNIMMSQKKNAKDIHRMKMERLFAIVDSDGSDAIEADEFREACKNPILQTWLQAMDLDIRDADDVYELIKGEDGSLSRSRLIDGMSKLKGPARGLDMAIFQNEMRTSMADVQTNLHKLEIRTSRKVSAVGAGPSTGAVSAGAGLSETESLR
mmetsp:Transcript_58763/g.182549  ORF Transcript_58763/g.182549 Transcript_58763/m.182549 type:complete len:655 (-) Transcript_58763:92-2056(-)